MSNIFVISDTEIKALGYLSDKGYNISEISKGTFGEPDYITKDNLRWEVKRLEGKRIYFTEKQINEFLDDDNVIVFDKEGVFVKEFKWNERTSSGFDIIFSSTDEFVNKLEKGTVRKIGGSNYILVNKKYEQGKELYYTEEIEGTLLRKVPKGTEIKEGDEVILSKEEIQKEIKQAIDNYNKDIEEQIEFRQILKEYVQGEQNTREQIKEAINRLDYLESKLLVEDNYRKEKIELQKFYEDYLLTKNVFYKFKKQIEEKL